MFLSSFSDGALDADGRLIHNAIDKSMFDWPYSAGQEAQAMPLVLDIILRGFHSSISQPHFVLLDVGAYQGGFSSVLLNASKVALGVNAFWVVHLYEPDPVVAAKLRVQTSSWMSAAIGDVDALSLWPGATVLVESHVHEVAVGLNSLESVNMYFDSSEDFAGDGTSRRVIQPHGTLLPIMFASKFGEGSATPKSVRGISLDDHASNHSLLRGPVLPQTIDILKVDAEGLDASILRGSTGLLTNHRVKVIIFEYGHGWTMGTIPGTNYALDTSEVWEMRTFLLGQILFVFGLLGKYAQFTQPKHTHI